MQATIQTATRRIPLWRRLVVVVAGLPLGAFFAFVGWYKAFAPVADLLAHRAWTAHLPWWLGRPVGWTELASAAALVAGVSPRAWPATRIAAVWLAITQIVSTAIHLHFGETDTLRQNGVLFAALALVAWASSRPLSPMHVNEE